MRRWLAYTREAGGTQKISGSVSVAAGVTTFFMALLLTSSLKSAVFWCGCCGAVICTADIILGTWAAWDKRKARRADFRGIVLANYSDAEMKRLDRLGEVLRVNRGQP